MKRILKFFLHRVFYPVLNTVIFDTGWWGYLYLTRNREIEHIYRDIVRRAAALGFQFRVPHIRVADPQFWYMTGDRPAPHDAITYVRFERRRGAPCLFSEVIVVEASAMPQLVNDFLGAKIALAHVLGTALMAQCPEVPLKSYLRWQIDIHGPNFPDYFADLLFMEFFLACLKETATQATPVISSIPDSNIPGHPKGVE